MEKRAGVRFPAGQSVRVTLLSHPPDQFSARVVNLSGKGMRLLLDRPISPGAPLKIEWVETLLLGEVCYCEAVEGGYAAGLELQHALLQTSELARLSRRLLCQEEPVPSEKQIP
jgi:hypothetical protein